MAIYAIQKAEELGAKVLTASDSDGFVYDPDGIRVDVLKELKEVRRVRIKEYVKEVPSAQYFKGQKSW